jgi:hypothetical protein
MSINIREIQEGAAEAQDTMADVATGAIVDMVDAASHPVSTVRKTARRLERKGEPVNTQLRRQATRTRHQVMDSVDDVVSGNLAERLALRGIRLTKARARRQDIVGDVLYVGLSLLHRGLRNTLHELNKFEDASQPPARGGERTSRTNSRPASPARRSTARRRSTASRTRQSVTARTRNAAGRTRRATRRVAAAARRSA